MGKAGFRTTEFWVTLLVVAGSIAIALIEIVRDKLDALGAIALIGAALAAVGYTHSRGSAKKATAHPHAKPPTENKSNGVSP